MSGDAFEALDQSAVTANEDFVRSNTDLLHKRSASQGSLHDNDHQLLTATRQESKNRLSFKMVKLQMKVSIQIWGSFLRLKSVKPISSLRTYFY